MLLRCLVILALGACGRIGFDPLGGGGTGDGGGNGIDGSPTDGSSVDGPGMAVPMGGETCASAVPLAFGTSGIGSIAGAVNDLGVLPGCVNGPDIVYRISVPATANHRLYLRPSFNAALTLANACPPAGGACQTVIENQTYDNMPQFQVGTMYVIIDKTGGTGTGFELMLQ
jgi:hypothetical protein